MNALYLDERPEVDMKTIFTKAVGQEIYRIRRSQGMTGKALAQQLNVSQQQVSRYECGVCHITIDTLILMLSILDVSIDEFFKKVYLNLFNNQKDIEIENYSSLLFFKEHGKNIVNI